jgi:prepilin-type N-terminal cleavage/methylation domain-containing protein
MKINLQSEQGRRLPAGMTLVEVVLAIAISAVAILGIISGHLFSMNSAQRWSLSLAANARAMERVEEVRSAKWDTASPKKVDLVQPTNFPETVIILDQAGNGAGIVYATNITTIFDLSIDPPLKGIRVDCIWSFRGRELMTNTIETCRAPDQ